MRPKRVLIITYYWPPSGGAGVQRWLKFVKYLPDFGWEPIIYTPENPEIPVADYSLEKDFPKNLEVIKSSVWEPYKIYKRFVGLKKTDKINTAFLSEKKKTNYTEKIAVWIRGNFFVPDARKYWIKPSIRFLSEYLKTNPVDVIISTGPPHSMHLIALQIKQTLKIPWIADFRDPWTGIDFYHELRLTRWADHLHKKLENQVLKSADRIVVVSKGMKNHFNHIFTRDYEVITNGFDDDDLSAKTIIPDQKFSIAHIGSLVKSRNPDVLWAVLRELSTAIPHFEDDLELKLVGKVDFSVMESINTAGLAKFVRKIDYLPHDEVIAEQMKSQVLLLLINNTPNAGMILTGKFFEYMAAKRPILCVGANDGDAAIIIGETGCGFVSDFDDREALKENVLKLYENYKNGVQWLYSGDIQQYSRKSLTKELVEILDNLIIKQVGK